MADVPLSGQDGTTKATDLPKKKSEIFFATGLERQKQADGAWEISLTARRQQTLLGLAMGDDAK
jgi:hypothetical protein